jgi:hypothetical protein
MKKNFIIASLGLAVCLAVGIGITYASQVLTKQDEVALKQAMKPEVPAGERMVDMVGVFPPQFESDADAQIKAYDKEYGKDNVQVLSYKGYTLIIPPGKTAEVDKAKQRIDGNIKSQQSATPQESIQQRDVDRIKEVFGTQDTVSYDATIGAYVDESGNQYNFVQGQLVNKQVGVTSALQQKWEKKYPHLNGSSTTQAVVTEEQAKDKAGKLLDKLFSVERASELKTKVEVTSIDDKLTGIVYGDNEASVLVDKVTGDIIAYSKIK